MNRLFTSLFVLVSIGTAGYGAASNPQVSLATNMGEIIIELLPEAAPKTVDNFLNYVNSGFYEGTIFHRVIKTFMIQGGGFTANMSEKKTEPPVLNEANNGLKNLRGTVAMARTSDPHSATAQFFINTVNNDFLNYRSKSVEGWGYCVFGKVIKGQDVVDAIAAAQVAMKEGMADVPIKPMIITKAVLVGKETKRIPAAQQ